LILERGGHYSFIDVKDMAAYDLFSPTLKFAIGRVRYSQIEPLEPVHRDDQLAGFYFGVLLVLFDDASPVEGLAKNSIANLATPLKFMERSGKTTSWKTLISEVSHAAP